MSKAFNRVDHNILIQDFYDMKCPNWLLKILFSFLSKRTLVLKYKDKFSSPKELDAGAPAGTLLGVIIFIVKFNSALLRPPIRKPLTIKSEGVKAKYMDDISTAVSVPLDENVIVNNILPAEENLLQIYMDDLEEFTKSNNMKINHSKSKVMQFRRSNKCEFPIKVSFENEPPLEEIDSTKLLGIMISNDLKWENNTKFICSKARKKIYLLRNMKKSGLTKTQLIDAYKKEIRSILELAVPVWGSGLTLDQSVKIERVQKSSLAAIFGEEYNSYEEALKMAKLERLSKRRNDISLRFIQKNMKSKFPLLEFQNKCYNTRSDKMAVKEFQCRTSSYFNSSLPYLARQYNANLKFTK